MRSAIRWLAALVVPVVLLTGAPVDAQKMASKDKDGDKEVNGEKMIKAGLIVGKVAAVYEDKKKIRLRVAVPVLNPAGLVNIQQANAQMVQARMNRDAQGMINAQASLVNARASLYSMSWQDLEVDTIDDVVVRSAQPKQDFDDKGKIKKITKAGLKEQKGPDPKLPGYKAEFGDLATEQVVQVSLVKKKPDPKAKPAPKPKPKGKGKKAEEEEEPADWLGDNLPKASMIVILAAAPPGG